MKITIASDLHLEFGYQELDPGDVLILAGDIAEERSITKHHHSTKLIQDVPDTHYRCSEFFKWECAKFEKVFYVMGNHEHYHGGFHTTYDNLKAIMPKNVTVLENEAVEYRGWLFLGCSLWTDMNKGDPVTVHSIKDYMNDYKLIKYHDIQRNLYHKLSVEATVNTHRASRRWLKETLAANATKNCFVITHHGPSHLSINEKYKDEHMSNGAYVSDLSDIILDHPCAKYWVHGHLHDPVDYMIGSTRIISNPRGYEGYEDTDRFRKGPILELLEPT